MDYRELPEEFLEKMKQFLGEEYPEYLASYEEEPRSGLGLDQIEETEDAFEIGAMVTLRQLEEHPGLAAYTDGAMRESVRHIVGVQLRNLATVGGSIYGRFGFSDVLTMFLAMDTEVELYKAGRMPLVEFETSAVDEERFLLSGRTPIQASVVLRGTLLFAGTECDVTGGMAADQAGRPGSGFVRGTGR